MIKVPEFQVEELAEMSDAELRRLGDDFHLAAVVIGGVLVDRQHARSHAADRRGRGRG